MVEKIKKERKKKPKKLHILIAVFVISIVVLLTPDIIYFFVDYPAGEKVEEDTDEISYSDFIAAVEAGKVEKIRCYGNDSTLFVYMKDEDIPYHTENPRTEGFKEKMLLANVSVEELGYRRDFSLAIRFLQYDLLDAVLIASLITSLVLGVMFMADFYSIDNDGEKENERKTSFDDIIGLDEIKKELKFIVSLMKDQNAPQDIRVPKGILLEGPPGNGKTMLARALATEAEVNFIAANASDFESKFIGETGRGVRKLFERARHNVPCIVFIDEIDAIGSKRSEMDMTAVDKEINGVLNTLLTQLDGITDSTGVTVIAATNLSANLDPALIRPGRFDKHFVIPNPDAEVRRQLFINYLRDESGTKYNYDKLVSMSKGCNCSEIENIVNEAKLIALKDGSQSVDEDSITKAIRQFQLKGLAKENAVLSDDDRKTIAIHEAGHAIAAYFSANVKVNEISICPTTSGVGGYTHTESLNGNNMVYLNELFDKIVILLAGKTAEDIATNIMDKVSIGSEQDINEATKLAMVYVKFQNGIDYTQFVEAGVTELMNDSKDILKSASSTANDILSKHKDKLLLIAGELESKDAISGNRFRELMEMA